MGFLKYFTIAVSYEEVSFNSEGITNGFLD